MPLPYSTLKKLTTRQQMMSHPSKSRPAAPGIGAPLLNFPRVTWDAGKGMEVGNTWDSSNPGPMGQRWPGCARFALQANFL
jgi:hypothetical protein